MTADVVALTAAAPSQQVLMRALVAEAPQLRIGSTAGAGVLELFDDDRMLVAALETPSQINVPGEARRLLGVVDEPALPYWWIELKCPMLRPEAVALAERIARAMVAEIGGTVWRSPGPR